VYGRGMWFTRISLRHFAALYADELVQFTTGLIGWSGLWSLMRPLKEGGVGFRFT
jgi:hypothetical protein